MNRIMRRARILLVLVLVIALGISLFAADYLINARDWVLFPGSPHLYNAGNLGCGIVTDRDGVLLMDMRDQRVYADNDVLRQSTVHWLGDRKGHISAPALSNYAMQIAGFDVINGVYTYGGTAGKAQVTLSARVQMAALNAMAGQKGTVAVFNYKTGEIICAVTTPTFDPESPPDITQDTTGTLDGVYLNRFVQSVYIPGSIFKIATTAAALEAIPDALELRFQCEGSMQIGADFVTCTGTHGDISLKEAFAYSCNCAFAQLSLKLGDETLDRYIRQFGILESIHFDGIATASGNVQILNQAPVQVAWSGIGQHKDQVNACAFMTFVGAIANDGVVTNPYLVSKITVGNSTTYKADYPADRRIMSSTTAAILQEFMRNNVQTIYKDDYFPGLTICAKSGTAEVGAGLLPNGTFAGFSSDPNVPLAFMIVVESSSAGSSGCLPILSEVLSACKEAV
ncbi:MAG: penicillin-binding protein [Oscillospiraceae bacterium]|nr:penicillin-binding protein [Oscillospiraceae bacterium]